MKTTLNILYKLYSFCIAMPLFVIVTIVIATAVIVASFCGDRDVTSYYVPKWWSRITCWLFLVRVRVTGREHISPEQSYVFLANHQGYFDIFLLYGYLGHNFKWMMKEYLRKIPFVGYACAKSGQIYVGDTRASMQRTVRQAHKTLQGGMSMVIFPEGTRTYTGDMGPFKKGAFTLANEIGLPIVPMTINGSFHVFNRRARSVNYGTLTLTIHPAITVEERQGKPTAVLMQQVHDIIHQDLHLS